MTFQGNLKSLHRILKAMLYKIELQLFVLQYKHILIVFVSSISQFAFPHENLTLFITCNLLLIFTVIRVPGGGHRI